MLMFTVIASQLTKVQALKLPTVGRTMRRRWPRSSHASR